MTLSSKRGECNEVGGVNCIFANSHACIYKHRDAAATSLSDPGGKEYLEVHISDSFLEFKGDKIRTLEQMRQVVGVASKY